MRERAKIPSDSAISFGLKDRAAWNGACSGSLHSSKSMPRVKRSNVGTGPRRYERKLSDPGSWQPAAVIIVEVPTVAVEVEVVMDEEEPT